MREHSAIKTIEAHHNISESQSINSCAEQRKPHKDIKWWFHLYVSSRYKQSSDQINIFLRRRGAGRYSKRHEGIFVMEGSTNLIWTWFHGEKYTGDLEQREGLSQVLKSLVKNGIEEWIHPAVHVCGFPRLGGSADTYLVCGGLPFYLWDGEKMQTIVTIRIKKI